MEKYQGQRSEGIKQWLINLCTSTMMIHKIKEWIYKTATNKIATLQNSDNYKTATLQNREKLKS